MSHTSPETYLVWSILSTLLGAFLLFHLWKFDRFKCLKWNNGPYSGAFKRLMTYTYLTSIPCIIAYSVAFAVIKYEEGLILLPGYGIVPKPWQLWSQSHKSSIFPLYLLFTIAWAFEMVTHLEELCFWLFLVNAGSVQQDWFRSLYFKTWVVGSVVAVTYMPLVTIFTRSDPIKCEAFTFLAGSLGSLSLTLWFLPILWSFPSFLRGLDNCVDTRTIVRLTTFHELNCVRVVFRLIFVIPLLILAVDGIRPHQHINESLFWTELLTSLAALGCMISSAITLVIFFPRSVETELQSRHATREKSMSRVSRQSRHVRRDSDLTDRDSCTSPNSQKRPPSAMYTNSDAHSPLREYPPLASDHILKNPGLDVPMPSPHPVFSPNRRVASGIVIPGGVAPSVPTNLTERALQAHDQRTSSVHPFVHNFTSPIDLMDGAQQTRWYVKRQYGAHAV
ncbi:hypothetical protein BN946_scf184888.g13 [Trametes cinnabarina]|uniref:Uncharacterized protein n=1 Tax=Pycnoporus cinnabarinus TaxID=5643 RepID=A0A060SU25_PYCCI|nr:hypothetical protein BN946_scf184888.g13 [Trametes cinnabarina]